MTARLLLIGLDAFEKELLLRWAGEGELPVLAGLLRRSVQAVVEGPSGLYAGAVWPSFSTGVNPARHRRWFRRQAPPGAYLDEAFSPVQTSGPQFWEALSDAGQRVAVVDVPHARPSQGLNGIQLVDWLAHEPEFDRGLTIPPELGAGLTARFGREEPDICDFTAHTRAGFERLRGHLQNRIAQKTAICTDLLRADDWDLFLAVFGEAHCAGHHWWHLHDPGHPAHDAALNCALGEPLKSTYRALDAAIGELIAGAGAGTRVMVFSSHGMGRQNNESVVLDEILRRLQAPRAATAPSAFSRLKRAWYLLPESVRSARPLRRLKRRLQRPLQASLLVRERQARRCFTIPHNAHAGAIRINRAGREAHGVVQPGAEYQALCEELRQELMALTCGDSGEPVVEEVIVTSERFEGPHLDELPDLLVEWRRARPVSRIVSPRIGTVQVPPVGGRSGDHTREGLLLASGPGLERASLARTLPVEDVPATVTALLGVKPQGFEGRPVPELLGAVAART